ncbi:MAG: serine O-acetyltransferase [Verrucomicrobia bacterium]|nr:serine O-acetyltransferase [Verrucomicrobiota bacterium]
MNDSVSELTDLLLDSYKQVGGINHLDGVNLPSKHVVGGITADLTRLLFPGFLDERLIHTSGLRVETARLMDMIILRLEEEVRKSLEYMPPGDLSKDNLKAMARDLTAAFMKKLPKIREFLHTDAEAAYDGDPAAVSKEEVIVAYPFIEAISAQRMAHELYLEKIPLIPRIMTEWAHSRTGIDIHPGARIGSHFFIDHGTGTIIGETCEIGDNVKIYHGVTLGAKSTSDVEKLRGKKRHPTIEDNVIIYPGATILGGETVIGSGSTIGGNVFLTSSVPQNSLVIFEGIKMKIVSKRAGGALPIDLDV